MVGVSTPFDRAILRYRRARAANGKNLDRRVKSVDAALEKLLAVPSPSISALWAKMGALQAEYGLEAQPRHLAALYADVAALAALYASTFLQVAPTV